MFLFRSTPSSKRVEVIYNSFRTISGPSFERELGLSIAVLQKIIIKIVHKKSRGFAFARSIAEMQANKYR